METNKVKVSNSPGASIRTIDELNNQGKKLINKLNHDCLAKVLMHLPVLERLEMENVCQKWEEAVDLSWYNVKKLDWNDLMIPLDEKDEILEIIMLKCCKYLRHLTIDGDHYPWMSSLLKDNCRNINHFSINMNTKNGYKWKISKKDLVGIINSMPNLKYLEVEMSGLFVPLDYSRKIVDKLPEDIHEIHLFVKILKDDESRQIAPILERFNSLRCLTLQGSELTNETLKEILQNKNTLSKLDLSYCSFPSNASPIFKNLKNLEHLNLNWVKYLSLNEVASIAHNCLKLKHFEVYIMKLGGKIAEIPYNIYRQLKNLNLEHLKIGMIDKFGYEDENLLSGMTKNWKQLKHLNLDGGRVFTNDDLQEITKLNNLEYVSLWRADVDSELFIKIANNCLKLKHIDMSMHNNLSETALFEFSNLKKLEQLCFFNNDNLTGNLLGHIADNCKNLVYLGLGSCNNITEDSLIKVGKLEHLTELSLHDIENVPNAMFDNFRKLEKLICYNCPSVTDEGIIEILDNCQKLNCLILEKTGITVESLVHAEKRKFVFKLLKIVVDLHVKNDYKKINCTPSPYLIVE